VLGGNSPLVWQCRYGGVEVPDDLWTYCEFGKGEPYSRNQAEDLARHDVVLAAVDAWADRAATFVARKGRVPAGRFRAYGYQAPRHRLADLKLKWRSLRMSAGHPKPGTSPAEQAKADLNRDATFSPKRGEGEKLREE